MSQYRMPYSARLPVTTQIRRLVTVYLDQAAITRRRTESVDDIATKQFHTCACVRLRFDVFNGLGILSINHHPMQNSGNWQLDGADLHQNEGGDIVHYIMAGALICKVNMLPAP